MATHLWLAARTGTDPRRTGTRGVSLFIVPMDTPGITITPIITQGGERTNAVFLDNLRVPAYRHDRGQRTAGGRRSPPR